MFELFDQNREANDESGKFNSKSLTARFVPLRQPSCGVFSPESLKKQAWDTLMFLWIVWEAIYVPVQLCFSIDDNQDNMMFLSYLIDACFFLDMIIAMNTGFYKNRSLIMNRRLIIIKYLKTWFILDLLATFPFELLTPIMISEQGTAKTGSKSTS